VSSLVRDTNSLQRQWGLLSELWLFSWKQSLQERPNTHTLGVPLRCVSFAWHPPDVSGYEMSHRLSGHQIGAKFITSLRTTLSIAHSPQVLIHQWFFSNVVWLYYYCIGKVKKVKLSLYLTNQGLRHEGVWGSECIDSLDLGTSWRFGQFHGPGGLTPGKEPPVPIG
jgi:hypothetical protein